MWTRIRPSIANDADDARCCARIARAHARTFTLASRFLPPEKRRAAFALYAFCRVVDDLVDLAEGGAESEAAARAAAYHVRLDAALSGRPDDPVFRELARAAARFGVPASVLHELVSGVQRDLAPVSYGSWAELAAYCGSVASTVGEMCTYVFGVSAGSADRALGYARTLGIAMQLTNILRDVGEDARRGRCYLPADELSRFGLSPDEVLAAACVSDERSAAGDPRRADRPLARDPRWEALMRFQIRRARRLYDEAMPGIGFLSPDSQRCAAACALGYAGILHAIERRGYDTFTGRARLAFPARIGVLWQSGQWPRHTPIPADPKRTVSRADDAFEPA